MAKLEKFRPILKPGRIVPKGGRLVYESENPFSEAILPIENIDFLLLCNGEYTVAEIIESIYHRKGNIQFKSVFKTLVHLKERNLLVNGKDLEVPPSITALHNMNFLSIRPFWDAIIGRRIMSEKEHPQLFYFLAMTVILSAIFSFQFFTSNWFQLPFLSLSDSYAQGILFTFFAGSFLLSAKGLLKCTLLLFLTGRAYNFGIAFNGLFLYLRTQSDSLFLISNRLYLFIYHLAVVLCYFPLIGLIYYLLPQLPYQSEAFSLAFILCFFDLHPFQDSELTFFVRSIFNDDTVNKLATYLKHNPIFSLVHPFERGREYNPYFFYTHVSLMWSLSALAISALSSRFHLDLLNNTLRTAHISDRLAAFLVVSTLVTLVMIVVINLVRILYMSLWTPVSQVVRNIVRAKYSKKVDRFSKNEILPTLEQLPLFNYFNTELLTLIFHRSELKEYSAGTPIIVQGEEGRHLFVLFSGELKVQQRLPSGSIREIGQVLPPSIFGEISVIEESPRMADVVAVKDSIVLVVPARMLRQLAEESHYIRELIDFRNAIMVSQYFASAPIFRELSENIIQMFLSKGLVESFAKDQIIFNQGELGDGFYLLLRGSVGVTVNGRPVAKIQQGGFFGEISMIADVPRTGTVHAREATQVLKISRTAFWEILSQDINMAMFIESVGEMRIREDIEILNSSNTNVA